ncbi:MAG: hypothetical protein IT207_06295 [Fimbriimonadaceae bacterium]|nr:hypothetical protein [Fimbriimonadaceae bacterium]
MKALRAALAIAVTALTLPGYFLSQYVYWNGDTATYIRGLDATTLPYLSTAVLFVIVLLVAVDREEPSA